MRGGRCHIFFLCIRSDQISCSVVSNSLWPHELQHARPPCPSPTPGVHSDSCPSSKWCHPAISSSVVPFSSCPQSLPTSESFLMSQLFAWGGQSTGVSASASFFPKKSQGWSPLEWTGWISLQLYFTHIYVYTYTFIPGEGTGNHSSIVAWRIPWTEEPGELHTVHGHKESNTTERLTL